MTNDTLEILLCEHRKVVEFFVRFRVIVNLTRELSKFLQDGTKAFFSASSTWSSPNFGLVLSEFKQIN